MKLEKIFIDRNFKYKMGVRDLLELSIGEHIETVDLKGMTDCKNLDNITCYGSVPPVIAPFTSKQYNDITLYVPAVALEAYQSADVWKNFWDIRTFDPSGIENVVIDSAEKVEVGRYDINGRSVGENYHGLVIIRYSDGSTRKTVL